VTNAFELGDYGVVSDGVLTKMGNIRTLGVTWQDEAAPGSSLDFASEGTRVIRTVGDVSVPTLPAQNLDAKITIEFEKASSFLIKANLKLRQMQNLVAVAQKLRDNEDWDRRYRVVSGVYTGEGCTVLSSKAQNSKIELTGTANALQQLDLGAVNAQVQVSSSEKIGLQIVGQSGVIGLSLFKLGFFGGVKLMGSPVRDLGSDREVTVERPEDWKQLEDDV
jgi:hypothetical protein